VSLQNIYYTIYIGKRGLNTVRIRSFLVFGGFCDPFNVCAFKAFSNMDWAGVHVLGFVFESFAAEAFYLSFGVIPLKVLFTGGFLEFPYEFC
jgi:hypothetical protein